MNPTSQTTTDTRVALDLEVEILTDADTLIPELVVDNDVATAVEARARIAGARRTLDAAHAVVRAYEGEGGVFCDKHAWCRKHDRPESEHPEVLEHFGHKATLPTPPHHLPSDDEPELLLYAQIDAIDPDAATPYAYLGYGEELNELQMDADQLEAFAGSLGDFRDQVLTMAAQLRQGQSTSAHRQEAQS